MKTTGHNAIHVYHIVKSRAQLPPPSDAMDRWEELSLMFHDGSKELSHLVADYFTLKKMLRGASPEQSKRLRHSIALHRFSIRIRIAHIRASQRWAETQAQEAV